MTAGPTIRVDNIGREGEPVVVIDNFSGRIDALAQLGRSASYKPEIGYPGLRSPLDPAYLKPMAPMLRDLFARVFGFQGAGIESCDFSVVSLAPDQLRADQRLPHHDDPGPELLALLHYTGGHETGGTSFFRHRRTGFEAVTQERLETFNAALAEDEREYGEPLPGYFAADQRRFECIGTIEAAPDRAILYRGRVLHSGVIPFTPDPATSVERGRLTINTFIVGVL